MKIEKRTYPPFEEVFGSRARIKILKMLAQNKELTISRLIKLTHSNHHNVKKHLECLIELGLVLKKRFGRIIIYQYNMKDLRASWLAKFIEIWEAPRSIG